MSVNKVILIGNVGHNPEMRYGHEGSAVAKFSMATSEYYKGETHTEWHNITAFGKTAEIVAERIKKGMMVYVEGSIKTNEWTGKDGQPRKDKYIQAMTVRSLERKQTDKEGDAPDDIQDQITDDDIPF